MLTASGESVLQYLRIFLRKNGESLFQSTTLQTKIGLFTTKIGHFMTIFGKTFQPVLLPAAFLPVNKILLCSDEFTSSGVIPPNVT